jgi:DNA-binding NarL/FixJ family response regulator
MIKLMMCDDHALMRDGILSFLKSETGVEIIGKASSGEECLAIIQSGLIPDILILDINMPKGISGYQVAKQLKHIAPTISIIGYSMFNDIEVIKAMIQLEAKGFVCKDDDPKEILDAVLKVSRGETYYPAGFIFTNEEIEEIKKTPIPWLNCLSPEKLEPVELMAEGLSQKAAAKRLFISESAFRKRLKHLYEITKTKSSIALIEFVRKIGLRK